MKGQKTSTKEFVLSDVSEGHDIDYEGKLYPDVDLLWFKLLEGEKRGLEFPIPAEHPEYDEDVESKLRRLDDGQKVKMKCESMNKRNTSWICNEIELL